MYSLQRPISGASFRQGFKRSRLSEAYLSTTTLGSFGSPSDSPRANKHSRFRAPASFGNTSPGPLHRHARAFTSTSMAQKSIFGFLRDQFTKVPPVVQADVKDKTIIVVGANTGLGFEAAQHFARMGAGKLILACRSQQRGEAALERLKISTGCVNAELWLVDLADFSSVKAFADRASETLDRVDVLMLNAGVAPGLDGKYVATKDGLETTLQVNAIAGSLAGLLLLPRMLETAQKYNTRPRLVVVSSETHYWGSVEDKVLQSPNAFQLMGSEEYSTPRVVVARYTDTKLLNVFFTRALSNRLKGNPIIVNTINPGFCYSEIHRNMRGIFVTMLEKALARTAEEGSRQLVWAAVGEPEGDGASLDDLRGAYINLSRVEEPAAFVLGEEGKKREDKLWNDLIYTLEAVDPRIKGIVERYLS